MGPLAKLGLGRVRLVLDSNTDTILIASTTAGDLRGGLGGGGGGRLGWPACDGSGKVWVPAAHLQVPRALGVLRVQLDGRGTKAAPDVNQAWASIRNDFSKIITVVVVDTFKALRLVVSAVIGVSVDLDQTKIK